MNDFAYVVPQRLNLLSLNKKIILYFRSRDVKKDLKISILIDGNIVVMEKKEFKPYYSKRPGWAEQDFQVWWDGLCLVCKNIKVKSVDIWDNIIGVTVTTQRDTGICVDKDGNPLRPAIIWLDQRMAECKSH